MLAQSLSKWLDAPIEVLESRPLGGGCISEVSVLTVRCQDAKSWQRVREIAGGQQQARLVIKRNSAAMVSNFRCEADGLRALAESEAIRVPKVFGVDLVDGQAILAMEWIQPAGGENAPDRFAEFGRRLAKLHAATRGTSIGWPEDNFLGSANQPNGTCDSWVEFVADRRIGFQIRWAVDQGLADPKLISDCETIIARMDQLLSGHEKSMSLLHGDLWSGNYLFDSAGQPVLIDPAVYRGCREAEWGMIKWFGNCPREFEQAYQQQWPMGDGWKRRVDVYLLYHQLNHLNLFGSSYAGTCRRTAEKILGGSDL